MPPYKPVTRVITLYSYVDPGGVTHIDVTPDPAEVIAGDTIRWEVQSAPQGVVVEVGKLVRIDPPPGIRVKRAKCTLQKPRTIKTARLKRHPSNTMTVTMVADIGYYKYDVLFNGETVLDPDIEIKGRPG